jgi:asparagine synthase (glutamine-hydrolysing)
MAAALSHRGPDDQGFWVKDGVGLAQTRLSIIDLAGGHQPLVSVDGAYALVANGEIYNHPEVRPELESVGCVFRTHSDCESLLHVWARDGSAGLCRLNGMFAFALHDVRRCRVVLGRDRLGIKPLYFAELSDRILFGSEMKALLAVWPGTPELDAGAVVQYLENQYHTGEGTLVRGIQRLPPGSVLMVDRERGTQRSWYWNLGEALDHHLAIGDRPRTMEAAAEAFQPLWNQVMREHLRSDVPYGLFLSGGVDSAILLASLRHLTGEGVRAYSVGFETGVGGDGDEVEEARRMAGLFGAHHQVLRLSEEQLLARLPLTVWAADDLLRDYACLPTSVLAETAARDLKVVLTGEGGDEVFAGYARYRRPRWKRWLRAWWSPRTGGYRTRGQWAPRWVRQAWDQPLRAAAAGGARQVELERCWREGRGRGWTDLQQCQHADLRTQLLDNLLVKVDRILMQAGLEGRVPYLDHRVVLFGLTLPDAWKVSGRWGKVFLRRWGQAWVPEDHLWRRKRGFTVPMDRWLTGDRLRALQQVLPGHPALHGWFVPDGVRRLLEAQASGTNASREIWSLVQWVLWHRIFLDRAGRRPSAEEELMDWLRPE